MPVIVGDNIEVPAMAPEPRMLELANMLILKDLPTGVIVGMASIKEVIKGPFDKFRTVAVRMASGRRGTCKAIPQAQESSATGLVYAVRLNKSVGFELRVVRVESGQ